MVIAVILAWCIIYIGIVSVLLEQIQHNYLIRREALAWHEEQSDNYCCTLNSFKYFLYCGFAGLISCAIAHTAIVPLDLVKCRIQVDSSKYKSVRQAVQLIFQEEGISFISRGWAATAVGYALQGFAKFAAYEALKAALIAGLGVQMAYEWRTTVYLVSSAFADIIADVLLCPWEAVKVRTQTLSHFPDSLNKGVLAIWKDEKWRGFYKGLYPLWFRQIPYTMMKFTCFERTIEFLYLYIVPKPRATCSKPEQLLVTFAAGYIAGVFCAIVSHPADSIVSVLNQHNGSSATLTLQKLGLWGIWKGLLPRILMVGSLTALQWFLYDSAKVMLHLPRPPPLQLSEIALNSNR